MPIYEYQCSKCGEVFEAFQKFSDDPLRRCKFCKGKVERLISQSSFHLKGSGWYLTDYARKSSAASPSDSDSKKSAGKTEKSEKSEQTSTTPKAEKSPAS